MFQTTNQNIDATIVCGLPFTKIAQNPHDFTWIMLPSPFSLDISGTLRCHQTWLWKPWAIEIADFPSDRSLHSVRGCSSHVCVHARGCHEISHDFMGISPGCLLIWDKESTITRCNWKWVLSPCPESYRCYMTLVWFGQEVDFSPLEVRYLQVRSLNWET